MCTTLFITNYLIYNWNTRNIFLRPTNYVNYRTSAPIFQHYNVSIFWIIIPYFTKAMIAISCTIGCQLKVAGSGVQWGFKLKYGLFSRVRTNDEWPLHRKATSPTVLPATEILLLEVDALIYHSNPPSLWSAVTIQCTSWILFSPYY